MRDFKILKWITLCYSVAYSIANTFYQIISLITPENVEWIKYELWGPWNDVKVNQKMIIKTYIFGSCEWF